MTELTSISDKEIESQLAGDVLTALDNKELRKSMRGANRKEANRLKSMVASAITSSGLLSKKGKRHRKDTTTTAQEFAKSYHARVYPDKYGSGFMVSAAPHGSKYMHTRRNRDEKPVAFWAEEGTSYRHVGKRIKGWNHTNKEGKKYRKYRRGGHATGSMPAYGILSKIEQSQAESVEANLFREFEKQVEKRAKKQGLI